MLFLVQVTPCLASREAFLFQFNILEILMAFDTTLVRADVCLYTFADGRCCRTPRSRNHAYFCVSLARREQAAENFGQDLSCFFSGNYLSASDLTTALAAPSKPSPRVTSTT